MYILFFIFCCHVIIIRHFIEHRISEENFTQRRCTLKLIKITGTSYNIYRNTFMFLSHKLAANPSYPYASVKRYVLSSASKTSRDEHSLTSRGSAFHNGGTTLGNIWSPVVTRIAHGTLRWGVIVSDLRYLLGSYNTIKSLRYLGVILILWTIFCSWYVVSAYESG